MNRRRTAKVAEAIRQVVSSAILFELKDPRVKNITVLSVEVSNDLRAAKVYISIMGDDKVEVLSLQGLNAARGWLQSRIADKLDLRLTPILSFIPDYGVKRSAEISRMLRELNPDASGETPVDTSESVDGIEEDDLEESFEEDDFEEEDDAIEDMSHDEEEAG